MYRNPKKKYILLLSQLEELPDMPKGEKIIRVKNTKQFPLLYKIMKYDLDIKKVIGIRNHLKQKYECEVKLDSYQDGKLWFIVNQDYIAVEYIK